MESIGDPDIEELKEEIRRQGALLADTNRVVHKLRRNIWWGRLWTVFFWVLVFALSGAAYYYYAQPYIDKLAQYYASFQQGAGQAQSLERQVQSWFAQLGAATSTK